jgi:flagellar protein FliS
MMPNDSGRRYLEDRVFTAAPQELTLMLLGSALQSSRRAAEHLAAFDAGRANVDLAHAEAILGEILGTMRKDVAPDLVEKVAAVYAYMIRSLTEAHLTGAVEPVRNMIRVLEVEHETWRQLCDKLRGRATISAPHAPFAADVGGAVQGGFTIEA